MLSAVSPLAVRGSQLALERDAARRNAHAAVPTPRIFDAASAASGASCAAAAALAETAAGGAAYPAAAPWLRDVDLVLAAVPPFTRASMPFVIVGTTAPHLPARRGSGAFLAGSGDDEQGRAAAELVRSRLGTRLTIVRDLRSVHARIMSGFCRQRLLDRWQFARRSPRRERHHRLLARRLPSMDVRVIDVTADARSPEQRISPAEVAVPSATSVRWVSAGPSGEAGNEFVQHGSPIKKASVWR